MIRRPGTGANRRPHFRGKDPRLGGIEPLVDWASLGALSRGSEASFWDSRSGFPSETYSAALQRAINNGDGGLPDPGWRDQLGTVDVTAVSDPWGGSTAVSMTDNDGGGYEVGQTDNLFDFVAGPMWIGFAFKKDAAATSYAQLSMIQGAATRWTLAFDPKTGDISEGGSIPPDLTVVTEESGWYYVTSYWASGSFLASSNGAFQFFPALGTTPFTATTAAQGTITLSPIYIGNATPVPANRIEPGWIHEDGPRIFSDGAILIEGERTNLYPNSADLSDPPADHINSITVTDNETTAPDSSYADLITYDADAAVAQLRDTLADTDFTDGDPAVWSAFLKSVSADDVQAYFRGKDAVQKLLATLSPGSDWARFVQEIADVGTGVTDILWGLFEQSGGGGGSVNAWGLQCEAGVEFAGSPIRTLGVKATRPTEIYAFDGADLDSRILTEGFEVDVWVGYDSDQFSDNPTVFWASATNGYLRLGPVNCILRSDTVTHSVPTPSFSVGDKITFRVDWSGDWTIAVNGTVQTTEDVSGEDWSAVASDTTCWIGTDGSANAINGVISQFRALT